MTIVGGVIPETICNFKVKGWIRILLPYELMSTVNSNNFEMVQFTPPPKR